MFSAAEASWGQLPEPEMRKRPIPIPLPGEWKGMDSKFDLKVSGTNERKSTHRTHRSPSLTVPIAVTHR